MSHGDANRERLVAMVVVDSQVDPFDLDALAVSDRFRLIRRAGTPISLANWYWLTADGLRNSSNLTVPTREDQRVRRSWL